MPVFSSRSAGAPAETSAKRRWLCSRAGGDRRELRLPCRRGRPCPRDTPRALHTSPADLAEDVKDWRELRAETGAERRELRPCGKRQTRRRRLHGRCTRFHLEARNNASESSKMITSTESAVTSTLETAKAPPCLQKSWTENSEESTVKTKSRTGR